MRTRHRPTRTCIAQLLLQSKSGRNAAHLHPYRQAHIAPLRFLYPARLFSISQPQRKWNPLKAHPSASAVSHQRKQRRMLEGASDDAIDISQQWRWHKEVASKREGGETVLDRRKLFGGSGPPVDGKEINASPFTTKASWKLQAQGQFHKKHKEMMAPGEWKRYVRHEKAEKKAEKMMEKDKKNRMEFAKRNAFAEGEVKSGVYNWTGSRKDEFIEDDDQLGSTEVEEADEEAMVWPDEEGETVGKEEMLEALEMEEIAAKEKEDGIRIEDEIDAILVEKEEMTLKSDASKKEEQDPFASLEERLKDRSSIDYRPLVRKKQPKAAIEGLEDGDQGTNSREGRGDLNYRTYQHRLNPQPLENERFKPMNEENPETPEEENKNAEDNLETSEDNPKKWFTIPKVERPSREEQIKNEFEINPPPLMSYKQMFDRHNPNEQRLNVLEVPEVKPVHKNPLLFRTDDVQSVVQTRGESNTYVREYSLLGTLESDMTSRHLTNNRLLYVNESQPKVTFITGKEPHISANTMAVLLENSMLYMPPNNRISSPRSALVFNFDVPADKFKDAEYDVLENLQTCSLADLARPHQNTPAAEADDISSRMISDEEEQEGPRIRFDTDIPSKALEAKHRASAKGVKSLKIFLSPLTFNILEPKYRAKYPDATILPLRVSMDLLDHYDIWNIYSAAWMQGFVPPWFQQRGLAKDSVRSFEDFYKTGRFDFDKMMEQMDLRLTTERRKRVLRRMKLLYALVKIPKEQFQPVIDRDPDYDWAKWDTDHTYGSEDKPAIVGENDELLGPLCPEPGNLTLVDLTCPFLNQTSAGQMFDLVLKAYMMQEGQFVLGMHQFENFCAAKPRHRRFNERIVRLARAKKRRNFVHGGGDIIFTSREPLDLEHLAEDVDVRILHRSHKDHLKSFRNTTEAQQKMYYGGLTKDDVQRRHVALGHTKNAGTYANAKTAIVQCMSLREPKEVERIQKEKKQVEHYINLRSNRDYLGPRELQERSPWRSLSYKQRRETKKEAKLLENALQREADGFHWHSQSIKVQIRDRLTYDVLIEAEEVAEKEEWEKKMKHAQMVREGKKLSVKEQKQKNREEEKERLEEERLEKLERKKAKLERWKERKQNREQEVAAGGKEDAESGEKGVVVDEDEGHDEEDDGEEQTNIKHEIKEEDMDEKDYKKLALEELEELIADGEDDVEESPRNDKQGKKEGEEYEVKKSEEDNIKGTTS